MDVDRLSNGKVADLKFGDPANGPVPVAVTNCITSCAAPGTVTTIAIARHDGTQWRDIAALFPEWRVGAAAELAVLVGGTVATVATARRSLRRPARAVVPGLLQGPAFSRATPWVSATVAHEARAGVLSPGWRERALAVDDPALRARAHAACAAVVRARIGGSFWASPIPDGAFAGIVALAADAAPDAARAALMAAIARHSAAATLVLGDGTTPRALVNDARRLGCTVVIAPVDPWSAIDRAEAVYLAGDHPIGPLALFAGRAVLEHGPVWFAASRDPTAIAAATLIAGARYADPLTGQPSDCEAAIALLADWRERLSANRRVACCVGISSWKRRRIAAFFHTGDRQPVFRRTAASAVAAARAAGGAIAVWNSRVPVGLAAEAARAGVGLLRIEDGFIRSTGLGSDFLPPSSIIVDAAGIYYDPGQPSDLEHLLAETQFDAALIDRATRLIARLIAGGVTKYGVAQEFAPVAWAREGRRTILVPGQVADDLSVRLGAGAVRTNLDLLRAVRARNSDACVIYKPHPDVDAGHRPGAIADADMRDLADHVVRGGAMSALIASVDEVHTMTSLAGFEALLRRRVVCVYGQPFYAGWGLTRDDAPIERRRRRLAIEELAACVLILYPRYLDPVTSLPCGPELLIERLAMPELWRPGWLMRMRQMQGQLRRRLQTLRARVGTLPASIKL